MNLLLIGNNYNQKTWEIDRKLSLKDKQTMFMIEMALNYDFYGIGAIGFNESYY